MLVNGSHPLFDCRKAWGSPGYSRLPSKVGYFAFSPNGTQSGKNAVLVIRTIWYTRTICVPHDNPDVKGVLTDSNAKYNSMLINE